MGWKNGQKGGLGRKLSSELWRKGCEKGRERARRMAVERSRPVKCGEDRGYSSNLR